MSALQATQADGYYNPLIGIPEIMGAERSIIGVRERTKRAERCDSIRDDVRQSMLGM